MRPIIFILCLLSFGLAYVEKQAIECGDGIFQLDLPFGLKAEWFNGHFWLLDSEGWGIIGLPGEVALQDGDRIDLLRVSSYSASDRHMLLRVDLVGGRELELSLKKEDVHRAVVLSRAKDDSNQVGNWVRVRPEDCNPYKIWRVVLLAGVAASAWLLYRHVRQRRSLGT